jgi:hypothetical protein
LPFDDTLFEGALHTELRLKRCSHSQEGWEPLAYMNDTALSDNLISSVSMASDEGSFVQGPRVQRYNPIWIT